jgi:hypothetical protein
LVGTCPFSYLLINLQYVWSIINILNKEHKPQKQEEEKDKKCL